MRWINRKPEYAVATVFVAGVFMNILDTTIVNVALPSIAAQFEVRPTDAKWTVLGYLMSLAVWIPASGWLGDRFGTKRTFLFALAVFTLSSALCGLADRLALLVAGRVLQGVGGGMLTPVGMAMLYRAFPPERRAKAARVMIVPTVIAPSLGPVLGGFLVDRFSWHWVFWVNLPVGVAAFTFGAYALRERRGEGAGRFDAVGFALAAVALPSLLYALSSGPERGWGSRPVVSAAIIGVAGAAAFGARALRSANPLLNVRLFSEPLFRNVNLASASASATFVGLLFLMPLYLQSVRGESALSSGLTTFPEALGVLVSSQAVGWAYPRVGPRRLIALGLLGSGVSVLLMAWVGLEADLWVIRGLMFVTGASMAFLFISQQAAAFARISVSDTGQASALFSTQRQLASALGVAVGATVLSSLLHDSGAMPVVDAYRTTLSVCAGLALLGIAPALLIRDQDAATSMQRQAHAVSPARTEPPQPAPEVL